MTKKSKTCSLFYQTIIKIVNDSFLKKLQSNSISGADNCDRDPRQVSSGHYVNILPTPLSMPRYIAHSSSLFKVLGFNEEIASSEDFLKFFSGDLEAVLEGCKSSKDIIHSTGWATGYALSIMGQELYSQCPFQNGNGYGDGRAISVLELKLKNKEKSRWEFQLKGAGRTPYCRGGDGRAVLRSSVREFVVSEAMASLGVPTTRALSLIMSDDEMISRPWYSEGSTSQEPDVMVDNFAAITTRASSSFLRVGQIELFGRRARKKEHPAAMKELKDIVQFSIETEYPEIKIKSKDLVEEVLIFVEAFGKKLSSLVAHWIRVGFCQGNFNSDNCSIGGFTLDYGPFGFMEEFDPNYQPWTGGGFHYSFLQQPKAAIQNFKMLCIAVIPILTESEGNKEICLERLQKLLDDFPAVMTSAVQETFSLKMGLKKFDQTLYDSLLKTMTFTESVSIDWTIFWRKLSDLPRKGIELRDAFYENRKDEVQFDHSSDLRLVEDEWTKWLGLWNEVLKKEGLDSELVSKKMKTVNPKYVPREWMLIKAYKEAGEQKRFGEIHNLQKLFDCDPYAEQSSEMKAKYDKKVDEKWRNLGGCSKMSCSS